MRDPIVIIGAGQAGAQAAESLRRGGYDGDIVMFGNEAVLPHQRPPLSKKFLGGELERDRLYLRPSAFYASSRIDLRISSYVTAIEVARHQIETSGGQRVRYAQLLIATGARARSVNIEGAQLAGVWTLRTIADVEDMRPSLLRGKRLVIVGGGYIGLEVAAVASTMGLEVIIVEATSRVMQRVVCEATASFFCALHRGRGIDLRFFTTLRRLRGQDRVQGIELDDGTMLSTEAVLFAVGAIPETTLAERAGIACQDGILVDTATRTSAQDVFAAGDCARFFSALYGRQIRLESVQNAIDQGKAAAAGMLGQTVVYDPVPWFWSDQYEFKLQIAGLSEGYQSTEVVGEIGSGRFSVRYISQRGRLLAVDAVNMPRDHMLARRRSSRSRSAKRRT